MKESVQGTTTIRPLAAKDLKAVVRVHLESFPDFFLSFLGGRFLREFYAAFLDDPTGMAFVAESAPAGEILGVVAGPCNPQGFFRRLLVRRWWAFCLASAGAVARKPTIVPRLFRALFYRGATPEGQVRSLLSSIAVAPTAQGTGIGRALVARWVEEAQARGSSGCVLTTDAANNEAVNGFYARLGWKLESCYTTPEGRAMNRYVMDFRPECQ